MAGIISVSRTDLAQRRKRLRRQRQMKIIQAIWRTFAITGLAGGLLWVAVQPVWVLKTPKQVVMKSGNQLLSDETAKSLLVLSYPQSLWRIEPAAIANSLKKQPTIAQAIVRRRLFPPGLNIEIQERVPVAVTQTPSGQNQATDNKKSHNRLTRCKWSLDTFRKIYITASHSEITQSQSNWTAQTILPRLDSNSSSCQPKSRKNHGN